MATSSCETLLASGHTSPGYYLIDSPEVVGTEQYEMVECKMGIEPTDPAFQQTTGVRINRYLPVPVAFDFRRITSYTTASTVVPYEEEVLNVGGAMSMTGVFTAPIDGVYEFSFAYNKYGGDGLQAMYIRVDEVPVAHIFAYSGYDSASESLILNLAKGQRVDVYLREYTGLVADSYRDAHFTGHLVYLT